MSKIDQLLSTYGESHQHHTNKSIHWICVPLIMFSLLGLVYQIPFFVEKSPIANWAFVLLALACLYYLRLSWSLFFGFLLIAGLMIWGIHALSATYGFPNALWIFLSIFVLAWIGQFIGHKIEGKKPSFLKDVQYLLIGPAWLLHFVFEALGIPYR